MIHSPIPNSSSTREYGRTRIQCRFENETVWLSQQQMAELFQSTQQNVSLHLQNIYDEGELQRGATHKESLLGRALRIGALAAAWWDIREKLCRYFTASGAPAA